jgi:hypothetical protein
MNDELVNKVESLKVMLVCRATGGVGNDHDYGRLRRELLAIPRVSKHLPQCVQVCRDLSEFWSFIKPKFEKYADRREYLRQEFDPLLVMLESESRSPSDTLISATVKADNLEFIQEAWHKALERRSLDPEGAITIARTLLETVCKHLLDDAEAPYDDGADLPKLYSLTAKLLNLSPSQHTEEVFKQILSGCHSVVVGLGAVRNKHSDAHGLGPARTKPSARHAELAVNLAGAMATFLLQTWESVNKPPTRK